MSRGLALPIGLLAVTAAAGCHQRLIPTRSSLLGGQADPSPGVSFVQAALPLGLSRSNEPASASVCPSPASGATLSYGTWLADFDGDGLLDIYDVNHGQGCHVSGLWLNSGAGRFGQNLWTGSVSRAATNGAALDLSNEMMFVGDLTGDGRVDMYFLDWSGLGAMCVNTGDAAHSDWTGPSFTCYQALEPKTFADVNGDGKIDIEVLDPTPAYDVYKDNCRTAPRSWRLNNGDPDFNSWPSEANDFRFVGLAAPGALLDFNKDGYPDTLQGVEMPEGQRGPFGTSSGGLRLSLGQPDGTYVQVASGLEDVMEPVVRIEDIDEDGCLDVGTDQTTYRDNQSWYLQDRSGSACLATFHSVSRTSLPYYPGARRYSFDVDNDGLMDKAVIVHNGYGNNDGERAGVHVFRKLPEGTWSDLGDVGIGINGTGDSEFYADELNPGDWNNDGKMDLAGVGNPTIAGTDSGIALWTSNLTTTNNWIKVQLPTVGGFFPGTVTIEVFEAGFAGDLTHYVTPPQVLRTGQIWTNQVHHFGIGTRSTADIRVTFPDGGSSTASGVSANGTVVIPSTATAGPTSVDQSPAQTVDDGSADVDAMARAVAGDGGAPMIVIDSFTITPIITDDVAVESVTWSVDGIAQMPVSTAPFGFRVAPAALSPGAHVISCQATDASGNKSRASAFGINRPDD
jgi:hypothetical protein